MARGALFDEAQDRDFPRFQSNGAVDFNVGAPSPLDQSGWAKLAGEVVGIGYWRLDVATREMTWSRQMYRFFAMDPAQPVDMEAAMALVHPDDRAEGEAHLNRIMREGGGHVHQIRVVSRDGETRHMSSRYICEHAPDGSATVVFGTMLDVTEYVIREKALAESEGRFRLLADSIDDLIIHSDFNGVVLYASPAVETLLGIQASAFLSCAFPKWVHPDDLPGVLERFNELTSGAQTATAFECRVRHADGSWRWTESRTSLLRSADGPPTLISVVRDIRERKQVQAELEEARRSAEAAMNAQGQFLANMSHEIRTPMNGVMGVLNLLRSESLTEDGRKLLQEAENCGRMLSQLLNDVIDFSKMEAGRLSLSPEPTDAADTVRSVVDMLRPQANAKGIALTCALDESPDRFMIDPVRLRQALFNLIGNAVKFTQKGGVEVRLSKRDDGDNAMRLRFEIIDTGVGIPAEEQALVFGRFQQVGTGAKFGGSGLGLAITRRLAELMEGEVGFVSTEGEGSTFWFDIRAQRAAEDLFEVDDATAYLGGIRILVVEDNPTNRLVARKVLEAMGATVETADDGIFGVEAVQAQEFDLVLMDVQMPRLDGVGATRAIRALSGPVASIPIIGLTANAFVHQRATYLAAGMNGVVSKPFSPAGLISEIARALEGEPDDGEIVAA